MTIHCDIFSAIHLCKNPTHHEKTKQIDIKLHFIINEVSKGAVKMAKVHIDENPAHILTKAVPSAKEAGKGVFDSRWRNVDMSEMNKKLRVPKRFRFDQMVLVICHVQHEAF